MNDNKDTFGGSPIITHDTVSSILDAVKKAKEAGHATDLCDDPKSRILGFYDATSNERHQIQLEDALKSLEGVPEREDFVTFQGRKSIFHNADIEIGNELAAVRFNDPNKILYHDFESWNAALQAAKDANHLTLICNNQMWGQIGFHDGNTDITHVIPKILLTKNGIPDELKTISGFAHYVYHNPMDNRKDNE